MNEDQEFGLVMPLVNLKSNGGLYDDESFCAGYEIGSLSAHLQYVTEDEHVQLVRYDNIAQADLVAMKAGFLAEFEGQGYEWRTATFTRATA